MSDASTSKTVRDTLKAMSSMAGREVTEAAAAMFLSDLSGYHEEEILMALKRFRIEKGGFPSVADIISRIEDGRPGVEEAWALLPRTEADSVVWTDEMAQAYSSVRHLMAEDQVAGRLAFKEVYARLLAESRNKKSKVNWTVSLGQSREGRETALREALDKGRVARGQVDMLLPEPVRPQAKQIAGPVEEPISDFKSISEILSNIKKKIAENGSRLS